jgi:hypothetical protein
MNRRSPETLGVRYTGWAALDRDPAVCRSCRQSLRVVPVIMVHDQDEKRRFEAVFAPDMALISNN